MAQDPVLNVTEPDEGENITVTSCFQANVTRPRRRAAIFEISFLNSSTADLVSDFATNRIANPYIVVPVDFSGLFIECVILEVIGDNMIEEDEVIEYDVEPVADRDSVENIMGGAGLLRVNIFDNDGNVG